jgi:CheY-like chemotaxis protein
MLMSADLLEAQSDPTRILLVDDDAQVLSVLSSALADRKVVSELALSAADAITAFDAFAPHITLVDQMLPGNIHGVDLIARFARRNPEPMQFLATGATDEPLIMAAIRAGAWSVLSKPYRLTELFDILDAWTLYDGARTLAQAIVGEFDHTSSVALNTPSRTATDLAEVLAFASARGASPAAARNIAQIVTEIVPVIDRLRAGLSPAEIRLDAAPERRGLRVTLSSGAGTINWRRELARARSEMHVSRIDGLYLAACIARETTYTESGGISFLCAAPADGAA